MRVRTAGRKAVAAGVVFLIGSLVSGRAADGNRSFVRRTGPERRPASPVQELLLATCAGDLALDKWIYDPGDAIRVSLVDGDLAGAGTQDVTIRSTTEASPETVTLVEDPLHEGEFSAIIPSTTLPPSPGDGVISVAPCDGLTARYVDVSFCGTPNVIVEDSAVVDCGGSLCVARPQGMLAWWPFDEAAGTSATDLAGANNAGSLVGGASHVSGEVALAVGLDGTGDYVRVPDHPELDLGTGNFTIDAWIRIAPSFRFRPIVHKEAELPGGPFPAYQGYVLWINNNSRTLYLDMGDGQCPPCFDFWSWSEVAVPLNTWVFVAVTVHRNSTSGGHFYLFADGVLQVSPPFNPTTISGSLSNGSDLFIGRDPLMNDDFHGQIDEVEIFNRALDPAEILSIALAGPDGKCKCEPDVDPPILTCPQPSVVPADASCQAENPHASATDTCDPSPALTENPPFLSGAGPHDVLYTAVDSTGPNSASCTVTHTVVDTTPPDLTCPLPTSLFADALCEAAPDAAIATDNCDPAPILLAAPTTFHGVGFHPVSFTATDAPGGNSAMCGVTYEVIDAAPPQLVCPAPQTLYGDLNCRAPVPEASASDNCDPDPIVFTDSDTLSGAGPHNMLYTAIDASGRRSECTVTHTVLCPACVRPPSNMLAWWRFDEASGTRSEDSALVNNAGANAGGATHEPGLVDGALRLDGVDGHVLVPNDPQIDIGTGDLTLDLWIRTTDTSSLVALVDKRTFNPARGFMLFLSSGRLAFQLADGAGTGNFCDVNPTDPCRNFDSGLFVATGEWVHVAVTVDRDAPLGGTFYVYANATAQASSFDPLTKQGSLGNAGNLFIGRHQSIGQSYFRGDLDELEIFNRALDPAEILDLAVAGHWGKCKCEPPPAAMADWWRFDEPPGAATCRDSAMYDNAGVAAGGVSFAPGLSGDAIFLDGSTGSVTVPDHLEVDFGFSDLSIDAWVSRLPGSNIQPIVDKRDATPRGYSLFLYDSFLGFQMADANPVGCTGLSTFIATDSPVPADGTWHHVAVTVDRSSSSGGHLYIDGAPVQTFDPTSRQGSLDSAGVLRVGQNALTCSQPVAFWTGGIDELEMFPRELSSSEVRAIFRAGRAGKCKPPSSDPSIGCKDLCGGSIPAWVSLPAVTPLRSVEDLCAGIPLATSLTQRYPFATSILTYDCVTQTCASPTGSTIPEPSSACVSSCFCVDPGEGVEVVTSSASRFQVMGTDVPIQHKVQAGQYLLSIPYHTVLTTTADLYNYIGGSAVLSVTRRNCNGTFTTYLGGSAGSFALVPGEAYLVRFRNPVNFTLPVSPPIPPRQPCACVDSDVDGYSGAPSSFACPGGEILDCDDNDATVWSTPGEVANLVLVASGSSAQLAWTPPWNPGGTQPVSYDLVSSYISSDFVTTTSCPDASACAHCVVASGECPTGPFFTGTNVTHTPPPPQPPIAGAALFYLVRAQNCCGDGPLGLDPNGHEISARSCP